MFDASVLPCWLTGLVRRLAVLAHRRSPETLDASVVETCDTSLMRLCSKHVTQRRSCRGLCFRRAHNLREAEIQQPWLSMNCNAHLARHRCDVPNPLFSDSLMISNPSRIFNRCGYKNPPPQEAYLYIFPARSHHITTVHLDFFQVSEFLLQLSRPDTRAHIRVPHMQCVCVCVRTHTHNTYTSTPCKKWGDTSLAQTNPSHWNQTPTVDKLEIPAHPSSTFACNGF